MARKAKTEEQVADFRGRILEAALALIEADGLKGLTMRARAYGFFDTVANAAPAVHFRMQHHASEALYSQDLPASAHVVTL